MTPVIHCSIGSALLFPRTTFIPSNGNDSVRCDISEKYPKLKSSRRLLLRQSSLRLFRLYGDHYSLRIQTGAAVDTDVTVEEPNSVISGEAADENPEVPPSHVESNASAPEVTASSAPPRSKRPRPVRKSGMPPVKDEELIPGAWFTGKVRSIQPFGCFVDFGAYTDGLVHVSRLSDSYVKDVASFVSIGEEVKVRVVEANKETGRISLTMRDNDDNTKMLPKTESPKGESGEKPRPARKNAPRSSQKRENVQKSSKFVKGQILDGTVKNVTRSGAFVSLPDGEEGFLPVAEESEGFGGVIGNSSLQVGQEVNVRVLRISRGRVTLTMKKEEDVEGLNRQLNKGVVHVATNPFQLAFRQNKEIAAFLDERDRTGKSSDKLQEESGKVSISELQKEASVEGSLSQDVEVKDDESHSVLSEGANLLVPDHEESSKIIDGLSSDSVVDKGPVIEQTEDSTVTHDSVKDVRAPKEEEISLFSNDSSSDSAIIPAKNALEEVPALEDGDVSTTLDTISQDVAVENDESKSVDEVSSDMVVAEASVIDENEDSVAAYSTAEDVVAPKEILNDAYSESSFDNIPATNGTGNAMDAKDTVNDVVVRTEIDTAEDVSDPKNFAPKDQKISETLIDSDLLRDGIHGNDTSEEQKLTSESLSKQAELSENVSSISPATTETALTYESGEAKGDFIGVQVPEGASSSETSTEEAPAEDVTTETVLLDPAGSRPLDSEETESPVDPTNGQTQPAGSISAQVVISQSENVIAKSGNGTESPSPVGNGTSVNPEKAIVEASGSSNIEAGQGNTIKSTVSPSLVKQLRDETGAGMMDCKRALTETGGDIIKAQEYLRKKGLASADKKASRATAEGRVGSYIHDNRIGVLIEVNCETDFVSRGEIFKELVDDLAMQVAACPQVSYLVTEDVPQDIIDKEREIEMQKEDLLTKPENIRSKIVDGRIKKRLDELALLEQPYIKNDKIVVRDWIKQTIATIGENIRVKRFVRYNLGEGLEKKSQDFAAEVAAQTASSPSTSTLQQQTAESKEAEQKPATVVVSAALVRQLREETGAGMMDCKKALVETGGDLDKAQEYLRVKGLSSAEKKSSRLAAEGRIASYIHDSRIGALIEVNCETDFVGRNENFKGLVEDLAMQVVACPQVEFVSIEDIHESIIQKEKEIEMGREDLKSKPEQIKEKIVEGRITKRLGELALLEQPFIKDDSIKVKDLVKQSVASLGENIKVRRFVRFTLGESKD